MATLLVVVVNPRQVRDFTRATGTLAKTDALDPTVLAHFDEGGQPPASIGEGALQRGERSFVVDVASLNRFVSRGYGCFPIRYRSIVGISADSRP